MSKAVQADSEHKIRGSVVLPEDRLYDDQRRVWNGRVDQRPELIVNCEGAADVIAALDLARSIDLPITVRGAGHSVAGKSVEDGSVLIDVSALNSVSVNPTSRTVRVGGGANWGLVDHETQAFGLAVTGGSDSRTGVAGTVLGGGNGYLARAFGLSIDHLLSVEMVMADGGMVTASPDQLPDLFWALRGGGGNFGIATSLTFRLNRVGPEVMTAVVLYPLEGAEEVLCRYREFQHGAPHEITCNAMLINSSNFVGSESRSDGVSCLALVGVHAGGLDGAEIDLTPLTGLGAPMLTSVSPKPYAEVQSMLDSNSPAGVRYYWKSAYLAELSDEVIGAVATSIGTMPGRFSKILIEPMGGAIAEVDASETAFAHRAHPFGVVIASGWPNQEGDVANIEWTRRLLEKVEPFAADAVYSSYLDRDETDRVGDAYGINLRRLERIKAVYDPDNVFRTNQNIVPSR